MEILTFGNRRKGHSLLEAIVATGVFIMVAIALGGVWVMYGKGLAKSGEVLAANNLARSINEGIVAKGWQFLVDEDDGTVRTFPNNFIVERQVRGRKADISYNVTYVVEINTVNGAGVQRVIGGLSQNLARIAVNVRWNSAAGGSSTTDPNYNNEVNYSTIVYKKAI